MEIDETIQSKAVEIFYGFDIDGKTDKYTMRTHAHFCVDQIISSWKEDGTKHDDTIIAWWRKVKLEIDKV